MEQRTKRKIQDLEVSEYAVVYSLATGVPTESRDLFVVHNEGGKYISLKCVRDTERVIIDYSIAPINIIVRDVDDDPLDLKNGSMVYGYLHHLAVYMNTHESGIFQFYLVPHTQYRPTKPRSRLIQKKDYHTQVDEMHRRFGSKFTYPKLEDINYIGVHTPIDIICPHHGVVSTTIKNHKHSTFGCRLCSNDSKGVAARGYTLEEVSDRVDYLYGRTMLFEEVLPEMMDLQDHYDMMHKPCGFRFNVQIGSFLRLGRYRKVIKEVGCPKCLPTLDDKKQYLKNLKEK